MDQKSSIIFSYARMASSLRDKHINNIGQKVSVSIPVSETSDPYGYSKISVGEPILIPMDINWGEYNMLLSFSDPSEEDSVPLTAEIPVQDNVPVGSIATIETQISHDDVVSKRDFRIIRSDITQNGASYSKRLVMVPNRGENY